VIDKPIKCYNSFSELQVIITVYKRLGEFHKVITLPNLPKIESAGSMTDNVREAATHGANEE